MDSNKITIPMQTISYHSDFVRWLADEMGVSISEARDFADDIVRIIVQTGGLTMASRDQGATDQSNMLTEGQRFPNACCAGYDVEVLMADDSMVITRCHNPQCPNVCGCGSPCPYDGVTIYGTAEDELSDYLVEAC